MRQLIIDRILKLDQWQPGRAYERDGKLITYLQLLTDLSDEDLLFELEACLKDDWSAEELSDESITKLFNDMNDTAQEPRG